MLFGLRGGLRVPRMHRERVRARVRGGRYRHSNGKIGRTELRWSAPTTLLSPRRSNTCFRLGFRERSFHRIANGLDQRETLIELSSSSVCQI